MQKFLLIAPVFFDYYKEILNEARILGLEPDYICDTPDNGNFSKALGRINKRLIAGPTKHYFEDIVLPRVKYNKYDKILVIGGMTFAFSPEMMGHIRELQRDSYMVLYQWDSERNLPYACDIHPYFDRVYTFDRLDSLEKSIYSFMPLFYTRTYGRIGETGNVDIKYDCSYIGTAHPKKFKEINEMSEALSEVMPRRFIYHYMPSRLKYIYHKMKAPEYKGVKYADFQTKKMSAEEIAGIISESKCVLDAPQGGQRGATIRTIECLGAKRKLITTNPDIVNYDFYRKENIYVYDGEVDINNPFFTQPYRELPEELYKKYSLHSWLKTLLMI